MLAIVMTAFTAATVTKSYAQDADADKASLYEKYTKNYKGTLEQRQTALEAARQFVEKYGADETAKQQVDYLKSAIPALEKGIAGEIAKTKTGALFARFDKSVEGKNYDDTYASGREILAANPDLIDVAIVLGSIGFDESAKPTPNTKYNADTINYAKQAIAKIESGAAKTTKFGAYQYEYKNKENALGWLNYTIGYLMYFSQNQKKEAIPYLYKASKYNSDVKSFPIVYQSIGSTYFDEAKRLSIESDTIAKANNGEDNAESKAAYALALGNADRAIDAYARAYTIANADATAKPEYKTGLRGVLENLFKFRYNGKIDTMNSYLTTVSSKPFVDPSTTVTPVVVETPAASTGAPKGNSSLSATSNETVAASAGTSKSAAGKGTSTTTKPAAAAASTTKPKAPVKKPATKKKGTR